MTKCGLSSFLKEKKLLKSAKKNAIARQNNDNNKLILSSSNHRHPPLLNKYSAHYEDLRQCFANGRPTNEAISLGSQPNLHQLPPSNSFSSPPQVPNTCTLPRRSFFREFQSQRFHTPYTENHLPPSYSRHNQMENIRKLKRPSIPPPPPRIPKCTASTPNHLDSEIKELQSSVQSQQNNDNLIRENIEDFSEKIFGGMDSGFESMSTPSNCTSDYNYEERNCVGPIFCKEKSNTHSEFDNKSSNQKTIPSKSIENLLTASSVTKLHFNRSCNNNHDDLDNFRNAHEAKNVILSDSVYPGNNSESGNSIGHKANAKGNSQIHMEYNSKFCGLQGNSGTKYHYPNFSSGILPEVDKEIVIDRLDYENQNYIELKMQGNGGKLRKEILNGSERCKDIQKNKCDTNLKILSENKLVIEGDVIGRERCLPKTDVSNINKEQRYNSSSAPQGSASTLIVKDSGSSSTCVYNGNRLEQRQRCPSSSNSVNDSSFDSNQNYVTSSPTSLSWAEWTQQLNAYLTWVNSQLSKRPDKKLISDLRRDFQNGVVFADLIEILAGEKVAGIIPEADSSHLKRENLDRVLQFMSTKHIKMTHITSREIAEGNLKSIMRMILALAAHYKPQSVREGSNRTFSGRNDGTQELNSTHNASSTLTSQMKVVTHDIGVGPDTPLQIPDKTPKLCRKGLPLIKEDEDCALHTPTNFKHRTIRPPSPIVPVYENLPKRGSLGANRWAYESLRASHKFNWKPDNHTKLHGSNRCLDETNDNEVLSSSSITGNFQRCNSLNISTEYDTSLSNDSFGEKNSSLSQNKRNAFQFWYDMQSPSDDEGHKVQSNMRQFKEEIDNPFRYHTIHRMSSRRKLPRIPGCSSNASSTHSQPHTPTGNSSLSPDDSISEKASIKEDILNPIPSFTALNSSIDDCREPEGRSQNSSPAASIDRGLKHELWREMPLSGLCSIAELKDHLEDQIRVKRNSFMSHKADDLEINKNNEKGVSENGPHFETQREIIRNHMTRKNLENEKNELSRRVYQKEETICELRKQILQRERAIFQQKHDFEEAIKNIQNGRPYRIRSEENPINRVHNREEIHVVRETIEALRSNFKETDAYQHTLDTLEQAISVLMEKSQLMSSAGNEEINGFQRNDKKNIIRGPPGDSFTKTIYFTDRSVTPFMSTINKRLGDISLRDFRNLFDRPGCFRFYFKNYDPEYGLVKEEITSDEDILPGVDGKIIAWIEEEQD